MQMGPRRSPLHTPGLFYSSQVIYVCKHTKSTRIPRLRMEAGYPDTLTFYRLTLFLLFSGAKKGSRGSFGLSHSEMLPRGEVVKPLTGSRASPAFATPRCSPSGVFLGCQTIDGQPGSPRPSQLRDAPPQGFS